MSRSLASDRCGRRTRHDGLGTAALRAAYRRHDTAYASSADCVLVPEQTLVATMRDLMVGDELRGIALDQTTAAFARVVIALEDFQAQTPPARGLVPALQGDCVDIHQSAKRPTALLQPASV